MEEVMSEVPLAQDEMRKEYWMRLFEKALDTAIESDGQQRGLVAILFGEDGRALLMHGSMTKSELREAMKMVSDNIANHD